MALYQRRVLQSKVRLLGGIPSTIKNDSPIHIFQRARDEATEWNCITSSTQPSGGQGNGDTRSSIWTPPPYGWLKCNHDACFNHASSQTGSDWIIRNSNGEFVTAASSFLPKAKTALEAEGLSFLHALQLTWYRGYRWIIFEEIHKHWSI